MTATSEGGLALSHENLLNEEGGALMPPPLPPLKPGWRTLTRGTEQRQPEEDDSCEIDEEEEEAIPSDSLYGSRARNNIGPTPTDFRLGSANRGGGGGLRAPPPAVFQHHQQKQQQQQPLPAAELAHWSSHGYLAKDSPDSNGTATNHRPPPRGESSGYVLLRRQGEQMTTTTAASSSTQQQQRARLPPPTQQQQNAAAGPPQWFGNQGLNSGSGGGNNTPSPHFGSGGGDGGRNSKYFSVKGLKHMAQLHDAAAAARGETEEDAAADGGRASFMGDKYFSVDSSFLSGHHADLRARLKQANNAGGGQNSFHPPPSSADNSLDFYKGHSPLHPPTSLDFSAVSQQQQGGGPPSLPPYQRPPPPPPPSKPQQSAAAVTSSTVDSFAASGGGGGLANSKNISGKNI
jgi:hypothetical protein